MTVFSLGETKNAGVQPEMGRRKLTADNRKWGDDR